MAEIRDDKFKLTDAKVRKLKFNGKKEDFWDTEIKGLAVRVTKRQKTFYLHVYKSLKKGVKGGSYSLGIFDDSDHQGIDVHQARRLAQEQIAKHHAPSSDIAAMTLGFYLDNYYAIERKSAEKPVQEKVVRDIKSSCKSLLDTPIRRIDSNLISEQIVYWRTAKNHRGDINKKSTVKRYFSYLRAVFRHLVAKKHIAKSPMADLKVEGEGIPNHISVYDDSITYEKLMNFTLAYERPNVETASKHRKNHTRAARIFIATVILHGLRNGEARKNTIDNFIVTGSNPRLIIPASITKTGRGREVPILCEQFITEVIDYKNNYYVDNPERLMFYNKSTGMAFSEGLGRSLFDEIKEHFSLGKNGNGDGTMYCFRHTYATRLYRATGDIKLVADAIGDNVETAAKYYVRNNPIALRSAMGELK